MPTHKLSASQRTRLKKLRVHVEKELAAITGSDGHAELSIGRVFADQIAPRAEGRAFEQSVFINCPFDDSYKMLFQAAAFAVTRCGFVPRCAKESDDSGELRLDKILRIIEECRLGIHDLSRIKLDGGYPRFNMPFELGLFIGAKRYGRGAQNRKSFLIFQKKPHTHQRFISDLQGVDPKWHNDRVDNVVREIRDWLSAAAPKRTLPGGPVILRDLAAFKKWLATKCRQESRRTSELTWREQVDLASQWTRILSD